MKKRTTSKNPRLTPDKRPLPIPSPKTITPAKGKGSYKRVKKVKDW